MPQSPRRIPGVKVFVRERLLGTYGRAMGGAGESVVVVPHHVWKPRPTEISTPPALTITEANELAVTSISPYLSIWEGTRVTVTSTNPELSLMVA